MMSSCLKPLFSQMKKMLHLILLLLSAFAGAALAGGNFNQDFDITWGEGRAKVLEGGKLLTLSLDKASGSGFRSKNQYLFGKIDMQIKLVAGNSAGISSHLAASFSYLPWGRTTTKLTSSFWGTSAGNLTSCTQTYTHKGKVKRNSSSTSGSTRQRTFTPTRSCGTLSASCNFFTILLILRFRVLSYKPKNQPMWIFSSLWDGEDWATRGGLVKTDWTKAPFTASYRNYNVLACTSASGSCSSSF